MLTREQAIEAAFYSGANLLSFTDERANNLDWMGARGDDLHLVKREAASIALKLLELYPEMDDAALLANLLAGLRRGALVNEPTPAARYSWVTFIVVLRACDRLMREEAAAAALESARRAGPLVASASFIPEDDRVDARCPDPFERITGADVVDPRPAKRGRK